MIVITIINQLATYIVVAKLLLFAFVANILMYTRFLGQKEIKLSEINALLIVVQIHWAKTVAHSSPAEINERGYRH